MKECFNKLKNNMSLVYILFLTLSVSGILSAQCIPNPVNLTGSVTVGLAPGSCAGNVPRPATLPTNGIAPTGRKYVSFLGSNFLGDPCGVGVPNPCFGFLGSDPAPASPPGNTGPGASIADINCGPVTITTAPQFSDGLCFGGIWDVRFASNPGCTFRIDYQTGERSSIEMSACAYNTEVADNDFDLEYAWVSSGTFGTFGETFSWEVAVDSSCVVGGATYSVNGGPKMTTLPLILPGGVYTIVWETVDSRTCAPTRLTSTTTVLDSEPPTFVPACPKGGIVNLNAGPGECGAFWDSPAFMAIDNCPSTLIFGQVGFSAGCNQYSQNFCGINACGDSGGYFFDLKNNSTKPMMINGFVSTFTDNAAGTQGGVFEVYQRNTPVSWRTGLGNIPTGQACPNPGSKNLWTLLKTTGAADSVRTSAWTNGTAGLTKDTLWLGKPANVFDTATACDGTQTFRRGVNASPIVLQPGEIRGIGILGAPNTGYSMNLPGFGTCATGNYGDGQLVINPVHTTPAGGIGGISTNLAGANWGIICVPFGFPGDVFYTFVDGGMAGMVPVSQTCGRPFGPGCFFPIGCTNLCYRAVDAAGNVALCNFQVCVNEWANQTLALVCNDEIQISLDQNCEATIGADMVLEGGPYGCYDDYVVEVRLWTTTGNGGLIDRNLTKPGVQINGNEIGRELKITVRDPQTGNSCWGHATVEDKLPPVMTCPRDTCLPCNSPILPSFTGQPTIVENCGGVSVSYTDNSTQGGCAARYSKLIRRTFTAVDASGNRAVCTQTITVALGDLNVVSVPLDYDNIDAPMLLCDQKIDRNKNVGPHMADFPECVDGYLLDSAYWYANPNQPNIYPNRRIPRVLGWNCIEDVNDPNYGHPDPDPIYYPAHRQWSQTNPLCWGPDTRVMWHGTGKPGGTDCINLAVTYKDIIFNLATKGCDAGPVGCYKVLRQWTVLDWCTKLIGGHNQVIKVVDSEGPNVLYPDSSRVNMETWTCTGRWDVPPAWIVDNCSNELHYTVEVERGTVLGNEVSGYVVVNMPEGLQNGYIIATDCCGNITKKVVRLNVIDRTPPQAVCRTATVVSLNGNQSPGTNYASVFAES
ncbi:MAG: HYR domain-containing protein, partial [Saprospiraceae bacterium]|nr:HYR domain-containing protein [Saprospiraceae bacterium]